MLRAATSPVAGVALPARVYSPARRPFHLGRPSLASRLPFHTSPHRAASSRRPLSAAVARPPKLGTLHHLSDLSLPNAASSPRSLHTMTGKHRIAIIGSGNWGSAIARIAGHNAKEHSDLFEPEVLMYVYEEMIDGKKLTDIINEKHENVKYLPGIRLPDNVRAVDNAVKAAEGADLIIFVLPHQFISEICQQLKGKISKDAHALSMIKGVEVRDGKIKIYADVIEEILGCKCSALSGANIANEVALDQFSETTIGYRPGDLESAKLFHKVFDTPHFRVGMVEDVAGVSLCGALKNVVALAAGFSDGLGWGSNSKAAIMRIGLMEMKRFSEMFFEGTKPETFTEQSAGVADLITTCFGGRNRKCAEAFVKTGKPFEVLEKELLNGQKLQGSETAKEIHAFLQAKGKVNDFPLFRTVYDIAYGGLKAKQLSSRL